MCRLKRRGQVENFELALGLTSSWDYLLRTTVFLLVTEEQHLYSEMVFSIDGGS